MKTKNNEILRSILILASSVVSGMLVYWFGSDNRIANSAIAYGLSIAFGTGSIWFAVILGTPEKFSTKTINRGTRPGLRFVSGSVDGLIRFSLMLLSSVLLFWLREPGHGFDSIRLDLLMLSFFTITAFGLIPILRRLLAARKPISIFVPLIWGSLFTIIAVLARRFLYGVYLVRILLDGRFHVFSNSVVLILCGVTVVLIVVKTLVWRRITQTT